jgi:hypothetical protein
MLPRAEGEPGIALHLFPTLQSLFLSLNTGTAGGWTLSRSGRTRTKGTFSKREECPVPFVRYVRPYDPSDKTGTMSQMSQMSQTPSLRRPIPGKGGSAQKPTRPKNTARRAEPVESFHTLPPAPSTIATRRGATSCPKLWRHVSSATFPGRYRASDRRRPCDRCICRTGFPPFWQPLRPAGNRDGKSHLRLRPQHSA